MCLECAGIESVHGTEMLVHESHPDMLRWMPCQTALENLSETSTRIAPEKFLEYFPFV